MYRKLVTTLILAGLIAVAVGVSTNLSAIEVVARNWRPTGNVANLERDLRLALEVQTNRLAFHEVNAAKLVRFELDRIETLVEEFQPQQICVCSTSACPPPASSGGDRGGNDGGSSNDSSNSTSESDSSSNAGF